MYSQLQVQRIEGMTIDEFRYLWTTNQSNAQDKGWDGGVSRPVYRGICARRKTVKGKMTRRAKVEQEVGVLGNEYVDSGCAVWRRGWRGKDI